jgi:hypothetical protein
MLLELSTKCASSLRVRFLKVDILKPLAATSNCISKSEDKWLQTCTLFAGVNTSLEAQALK